MTVIRMRLLGFLLVLVATRVGFSQYQTEQASGRVAAGGSAEAHLGAGYENLKYSRYEAAAREFQAALALNPRLVLQARFPMAVSLFELHRDEEARREFEAVRRDTGDHPNVEYYLGRLDLAEGELDSAIRELSKAAVQPPFPDTAYYLGVAYLRRRDTASAEKWLAKAAELLPRDPAVQYQLGLFYSQAGRSEQAQGAFARSQELRRREAEVDRLRGDCSRKLDGGVLEDARLVCQQLFDAEDVEKLTMLGTLYGQHGYFQEALGPLRRAAALDPTSPQTQYNLAFDFFQLQRYRDAREPLEEAVKRWPDLFRLNALLGAVLHELGEDAAAYRVLTHAHELNPEDSATTDLAYSLAGLLAQESRAKKQFADSIQYLTKAAELRPGDPEPHRRLAEIYSLMGQAKLAEDERREAERLFALRRSEAK